MKYLSPSRLKKELFKILAEDSSERIMVMKKGQPVAVILSISDYNSMQAGLRLRQELIKEAANRNAPSLEFSEPPEYYSAEDIEAARRKAKEWDSVLGLGDPSTKNTKDRDK